MIVRRIPMLVVSTAAAAALAVATWDTAPPTPSTFAAVAAPWMPAVPATGGLTSSWFCPGVPSSGEAGVGGALVIANADADPMNATVTLLAGVDQALEQVVTVAPYDTAVVDIAPLVTAPYVSAVVEVEGGGGVVEQRTVRPVGESSSTSVTPCATSTGREWYLAEGFTAEGSVEQILLTNPYDEVAIVDIGFATGQGSREPAQLQGYPVPARSVQVIDMDAIAARDELEVAVKVEATFGSVVVGRSQVYQGTGRLGSSVTLGAPALRSQWWFVNGDKGPGVTERFSIYNPTEDDVEVQATFLGIQDGTDLLDPIVVPARQVVTYGADDVPSLLDGRHAVVFATTDLSQSIVVERSVTRTIDEIPTTSVLLGGVSRPEDGDVASTWTMAAGPGEATEDALVVYNIDNADAAVTVQAVTPEGIVTVPSLAEVALPAGGLITIPLTEPELVDNQVIVRSTSRVFVERSLPREPGAEGRVASWAVPSPG